MRFFKKTLSVLVVAIMLVQLFPVQLFVTDVSAATTPSRGYYYKRVAYNQIAPGKEYLILSSRSNGTAYALKPASGAASGNVQSTSAVAVTVSDDKVLTTDSNVDYSALEWQFMRSTPSTNGTPELYMLQNSTTGSWLWNPVYENDSHYNMGTCITPDQDDYNGATMALFNFQSGTSYTTANLISAVSGSAAYQGQWLRVQSSGDGSFTVNFTRGTLPAATWKYMAYTYHSGLTSDGTPLTNGARIGIFTDTSTKPGPSASYYYGGQTIGTNWNAPTFDLYTSISNDGFKSGNIEHIRIDYQDGSDTGRHAYIDSVILGKTVRGIQTIAAYRAQVAWYRSGGLMPSVEYPFCQFSITQNGNGDGARLRFFAHNTAGTSSNHNDYENAYYYLKAGSSGYTYDSEVTSVFFFEKVYETSASYVLASNFEPGGEYLLVSTNNGTGYMLNAGSTNGGVSSATVSGNKITSGASATHEVIAYKCGAADSSTAAYWVQSANTQNFIMSAWSTSANAASGVFTYPYPVEVGGYALESSGICNTRLWYFTHTNNNNIFRTACIKKDQTYSSRLMSISSTNFVNSSATPTYLYEKTYHEHTWTQTGTSDATCTTGGGVNYQCSGCGQTQTIGQAALGHDYKATKTDATCTTAGYTTYTCSRCGDSYIADHVNALGHAEQTVPGTPATCNSTGLTDGKICSRCGITLVEQTTIPMLEHDWQVTSTEGSCGQIGVTNYKCSLCGETKREEGAVIQHLYDQVVVTPPDCDDEGYTTHTCSKCGDSYTDTPVAALGHSYGSWYTVTHATTTSDGLERRDCTRCDHYETQAIPMLESAKLKGSEVTTEPGETVTIDFELRGNPGIWGMNFVVYWPEALTFVKAESSDEAFPLGDIEGNENAPVDPATNTRMGAYFADANIPNPDNYMAFAYYVDNGGFENNYNNGKIISITFTLPENNCLKEYPVGVFGVYASSGNDIIDANGDTVADFSYVDGKIIVPTGIDCDHSNFEWVIDVQPTCTTNGSKHKVCKTCYVEFEENTVIEAAGHSWTEYTIIREPSGLSAGISRRTCTVCGAYEDMAIEGQGATGTGISASVNSETYRYHYTVRMYAGREYMILSGDQAPAYALGLDENYNVVSVPVTFDSDGHVINDDDSLVWSTSTGISLCNKKYGKWLSSSLVSFDNTSAEMNYSDNIYVLDTPYSAEDSSSFNAGTHSKNENRQLYNENQMYLAFGDLTNDVAHPDDRFMKIGNYALLKTNGSSTIYTSSEFDWSMEFDFSFGSASSWFEIFRDDDLTTSDANTHCSTDFGIKIVPGQVSLLTNATAGNIYGYVAANNHVENTTTVATQTFITGEADGHNYDFTHWHHFKVDYTNGTLRIFIDGVELTALRQTNYQISRQRMFFFNTPDRTVGMDNLFVKAGHCYQSDSAWVYNDPQKYMLHIHENFSTSDNTDSIYSITGSEWDHYGSTSATKVIDGSHGEDIVTLESNVFYASEDDYNEVLIYEKKLDSEMSVIYQLADGLESGESYVLVKANKAGETQMLNASDASTKSVTVYEDGVSISPNAETYLPYIDLLEIGGTRNFYDNSGESVSFKIEYGSNSEFYATACKGGFLLNYVPENVQENKPTEGTFLTTNGKLTASATDANVINVVDGKVTIAGEEYYVYKKVCVDLIDTAYENDMAVVDFGFGFNLSADFIRANDPWSDRVDVTLTGIAASISGQKNVWFYPNGARRSGAGNSATVANGTATFNGGISFTNSGKYESIVTVDYEGKVEHLGAYMYSTLYIIPATSVYYEDDASFITYTNSNTAGSRGSWEKVAGDSPVVDVLDAQYGNSTSHSSYLQYSGNSVHKVSVGPENVPESYADGWMPSASFEFTGTGFDVISAIGRTTCVVFVEITGATNKSYIVDNYLGYSYDAENGWVPSGSDTAIQLYQVPVIKWENDTGIPATYNVKISVAYDSFFDHAGVGYSEFYLDGIRVYNPINVNDVNNKVATDKYMEDNELIISEDNLRRLLITNASEQLNHGQTLTGALFIDGSALTNTTNDFANYNEVGAANEITLTAKSGIAFTVTSDVIPAKVALGIKSSNGGAGTILVSSGSSSTTVNTATATDMYYDVTSGVEWKESAGRYSATITIVNDSASALVSLTNFKLTTGVADAVNVSYSVTNKTENIAYRTLATLYGVNGEEFVVGDVYDTKTVNGMDTLTLKKYITGTGTLDAREYAAADINGDGLVNAMDALLLKKLMLN